MCVCVLGGTPFSHTPSAVGRSAEGGGDSGQEGSVGGGFLGAPRGGISQPCVVVGTPPASTPTPKPPAGGNETATVPPPPPSPIPTHTVLRRWGGLKADSAEVRKFIGKDRQLLCSQYKNRLCRGRGLGRGLPAAPMQKG